MFAAVVVDEDNNNWWRAYVLYKYTN
jgi:hypothetical protein